jgi:hypothetical protein
MYHLQNKFFIEQFYLLNLPQVNSKKNIHSPILNSLSQDELKNYSEKKIKKNRKKHPQRTEIELKGIDNEINENNDKYDFDKSSKLTTISNIRQDPYNNNDIIKDENIRNKYNSYIIGRIINLIRIQIEDKNDNDVELKNI